MSESAVILEGEVARRFNPVDKLRVTNQDSSVSDWVPSDTLDLGSLMASENTLYLANLDDDCDAYEEVEVDVSEELEDGDYKKITGKGNDGNDYAVGLDENGNLTSEMIPSAIHIVIKPRKLEYEDGETLDFTGIHVYLMDGNNKRYTDSSYPTGEIPFEELLLPITTADASKSSDQRIIDSDITDPFPVGGFYAYAEWSVGGGAKRYTQHICRAIGFTNNRGSYYNFVVSSKVSGTIVSTIMYYKYVSKEGEETPISGDGTIQEYQLTNEYTHNGKTVYYRSITFGHDQYEKERSPEDIDIDTNDYGKYAWALEYGEVISTEGQEIPVQWTRSDGEILEDKFSIEVSESGGNNSNSGTSDSGSGHTSGGF